MKGESKEFSCHTLPIYLTYPLRQKQNLPLGHKKKKKNRPCSSLCQICFPLFFPLALFFSLWLCSSKLLEHSGCAVKSSDSQRIWNYQGQQVFYVWAYLKQTSCADTQWVHSLQTCREHSLKRVKFAFEKLLKTVHWMSQVALVKQSRILNIVYAVSARLRQNPDCLSCWFSNFCPESGNFND